MFELDIESYYDSESEWYTFEEYIFCIVPRLGKGGEKTDSFS
jgi:hypothetical protein